MKIRRSIIAVQLGAMKLLQDLLEKIPALVYIRIARCY